MDKHQVAMELEDLRKSLSDIEHAIIQNDLEKTFLSVSKLAKRDLVKDIANLNKTIRFLVGHGGE